MTTLPAIALEENPVLASNPAVLRPDWLPSDSPFDDLTDAHAAHVALLQEIEDLQRQRGALIGKFEQEDEDYQRAQATAYLDGDDAKRLPRRTPQPKRDEQIRGVWEQLLSKSRVFGELVTRIIATVKEHEREWCSAIAGEEDAARRRVHTLRQELAAAEAFAATTPRLRLWIERTSKDRPGLHHYWGWYVNEVPTTDLLTVANQSLSRATTIPSPALIAAETATDPEKEVERTSQVPGYDDEVAVDYGSPEYIATLDRNLREHAQKRRAGSAVPGGL
jgi:hypothetical protein